MSFNSKDTDKSNIKAINTVSSELNKDDLDIKTHLNSSFELEKITVSEELIQKTLEAIKQSDTIALDSGNKEQTNSDHQQEDKRISEKLAPWYKKIRIVAGAAAAVLVVVAGLNFYNNIGKKNMDQMNTQISLSDDNGKATDSPKASKAKEYSMADSSDNANANKTGAEKSKTSSDQKQKKEIISQDSEAIGSEDTGEGASADDISIFEDKSSDDNDWGISAAMTPMITGAANQTGSMDNSNGSDNTNAVGNDQEYADTSVDKSTSSTNQKTAAILNQPYLSFQKIAMTTPKTVQKITIIDETNHTKIFLTDQKSIESFYTVMSQQKFIEGSNSPSTINYTIISTAIETNEQLFRIKIGDSIKVSRVVENTVYEKIYNTVDKTKLINNLETFYQQNSK